MSPTVEKLRLREVYHHLLPPPTSASELTKVMRASALAFQWIISDSSPRRDNGEGDPIPLLGDKQEL
jgi:hypothetical protein